MFKNYLKIALRNLVKHKTYSIISIIGLAIGMTCTLFILLWVQNELSYDRYHEKADRVFRVLKIGKDDGMVVASVPFLLGPALVEECTGVEAFARFYNFWGSATITANGNTFKESNMIYTEPSVLDIFSLKMIEGDSQNALQKPQSFIISETIAQKYFGNDNPIGKTLIVDNDHEFIITGVFEDMPQNSHFRYDFFANAPQKLKNNFGTFHENWGAINFSIYLLLAPGFSITELEKQLPAIVEKYAGKEAAIHSMFDFQPLTKIHLYSSHIRGDSANRGNITTVYIFSVIAILIIAIACLNYMNLLTARSTVRAKEVGLRKVVGANRSQLVKQFLSESTLTSIFALLIAILMVEIALPGFNKIIEKNLTLNLSENLILFIGLIGIVFFVGIFSGSYPALFLSAFQPVQTLKGKTNSILKEPLFRKIFIIIQFSISIMLIIGVSLIYHQLYYLNHKSLGFNKDHILVIDRNSNAYQSFRNELLLNSNIIDVTSASALPPNEYHFSNCQPEGFSQEQHFSIKNFFVDDNYLDMLDMELIEGRNFSSDFITDKDEAFIINETAMKTFGWNSAIGKKLTTSWGNQQGKVIGVVKDFHFKSLHHTIEPALFSHRESNRYCVAVKIKPDNVSESIAYIEKTWHQFNPEWPFSYSFIDEAFDRLYRAEQRMIKIAGYSAILAILIAALGLFGLTSFTTERRIKEIGIRKVLGASVHSILYMLTKDFTKWVLLANIFAWPIAWYAMNKWLQNFAYHVSLSWWIFVLAGGMALVIALLTVSYQVIRAATANPVESLRYE